jgi:hypothetical protein
LFHGTIKQIKQAMDIKVHKMKVIDIKLTAKQLRKIQMGVITRIKVPVEIMEKKYQFVVPVTIKNPGCTIEERHPRALPIITIHTEQLPNFLRVALQFIEGNTGGLESQISRKIRQKTYEHGWLHRIFAMLKKDKAWSIHPDKDTYCDQRSHGELALHYSRNIGSAAIKASIGISLLTPYHYRIALGQHLGEDSLKTWPNDYSFCKTAQETIMCVQKYIEKEIKTAMPPNTCQDHNQSSKSPGTSE